VLLVADDGVGIDPEVREAVFDVGWTTAEPPAAGIGLAAANSAVAMMEGSIRAVDSPYGGAAFRVELPQRPARAPAGA
jgi:signal transduction histidine kinase